MDYNIIAVVLYVIIVVLLYEVFSSDTHYHLMSNCRLHPKATRAPLLLLFERPLLFFMIEKKGAL